MKISYLRPQLLRTGMFCAGLRPETLENSAQYDNFGCLSGVAFIAFQNKTIQNN